MLRNEYSSLLDVPFTLTVPSIYWSCHFRARPKEGCRRVVNNPNEVLWVYLHDHSSLAQAFYFLERWWGYEWNNKEEENSQADKKTGWGFCNRLDRQKMRIQDHVALIEAMIQRRTYIGATKQGRRKCKVRRATVIYRAVLCTYPGADMASPL